MNDNRLSDEEVEILWYSWSNVTSFAFRPNRPNRAPLEIVTGIEGVDRVINTERKTRTDAINEAFREAMRKF